MTNNSLFTAKSMKHMNPLENTDEYTKIVRPSVWLYAVVPVCAALCVLAWLFLSRV